MSEPSPEELAAARPKGRHAANYLPPDIHRLLPQSPEAEMGVLSATLLSPIQMGSILSQKKVTTECFHIPAHQEIFRAALRLINDGKPADFIHIAEYLRDRNLLEAVGGAGFVTSLYTYLPTSANATYYIDILKEKKVLRDVIKVCSEFQSKAYEEQDEVPRLMCEFEKGALEIRDRATSSIILSQRSIVQQATANIQKMYEMRGKVTGLECGFPGIDAILNGLQPEMIVIAARPSQGKTALAMAMAEHIAVNLGKPVGINSLEMSATQLMQRSIASRARVNLRALQQGYVTDDDFVRITEASNELAAAPIHIDDTAGLSIDDLRARARRWKYEFDIQALFVDYLQLVRSMSKRAQENRQIEIAEVSGGLKAMCKELGIPIVVLAQVGRQMEKRGPLGRPMLSDLKESGAIEQDADSVNFLVRKETYAETEEERREVEGQAEFITAKQRNGPLGDVALTFIKEFTRFESRAEYGDHDEADAVAARERARKHQEPDLPL